MLASGFLDMPSTRRILTPNWLESNSVGCPARMLAVVARRATIMSHLTKRSSLAANRSCLFWFHLWSLFRLRLESIGNSDAEATRCGISASLARSANSIVQVGMTLTHYICPFIYRAIRVRARLLGDKTSSSKTQNENDLFHVHSSLQVQRDKVLTFRWWH